MPIQFNEENGGKILVVQVSGKLVKSDYGRFVPEFERLARLHGKLRVLFDMSGLHGWTAGAMWEDTKFAMHHFNDIERLAVVGEKKWQEGMATFCKPFTKATVQYFDHTDAAEARKWLDESVATGNKIERLHMLKHQLLLPEGKPILEPEGAARSGRLRRRGTRD